MKGSGLKNIIWKPNENHHHFQNQATVKGGGTPWLLMKLTTSIG